MFKSVLIANRGEIALRIQRACRRLGLRTIVVHSEPDREALYVRHADQALCIGPAATAQSYLNQKAILFAAEVSGAEAVHPGYGFLSENAGFAEQVEAAGLTFIGPTAASMRVMGDKIAAKRAMRAAGVPCVPGPDAALTEDLDAVRAAAREIGYPVILKAAGGGGGRGMRVVESEGGLRDALLLTREEARRAFGNSEIYVEKFLGRPRHVEIQVIADTHGDAVWLGSRDCSLQRRHQKVIEEAPAPLIGDARVREIGERCAEACRQIGYRGVGTFEFLVEDDAFYFIEMNTRLQVEHPVTEMTTGIDLVEAQIRVAQGGRLPFRQDDIACHGHAFECRINAEDPDNFVPSPGVIDTWQMPGGPGVRIDSHASAGYRVSSYYDSLLGKLIVHGATRDVALARLQVALDEARIEGIATNLPLHRRLVADPEFIRGGVSIHHLETKLRRSGQP
ncbi:acetyl-CoA carboxylase biotin carboxylase subunit [Bradyrhizobium sp. WYCCWR 13023]|uniref:Biotin carboxylase n=1 Tax=Bradyrhizobium zhengyangense TaxID=2911009 RepID=A0A9X1R824_9BRAD|nr:acetyl-CoA carboxylase biotin carboxylase subunit [Bradyrhizobium zhengyangense]MCG2626735.1 acetyl-CoA carboxylase biotin carboxylase subunit [Bradyrhizobium zhengyangense]MCG2638178.1 acetyl-CoA carboxylase biotin carboxylase subunit [Bradyrhizobium zhengyangense]MCG2666577.1 acetyl-CoA carboxylase biotin carboxylase subunit [Bradyrhizobium zhengyangense]